MEKEKLLKYFIFQRQIFGICPHTTTFFRLSEAHIYQKKKPESDWYQKIDNFKMFLQKKADRIDEQEDSIREKSKVEGRKKANRVIRKIDHMFHPLKLNPDDSKVIFHPIDFVVFNGMKKDNMKNLILLDGVKSKKEDKVVQRSIETAIEKEKYEWITLKVKDDGLIESQ